MEGMKLVFSQSDWMKNETKKSAILKMKHMKTFIAYGEEAMDNKKIDELYKEFTVLKITNNFANNKRNILKLIQGMTNSTFLINMRSGPENNAYYYHNDNKLTMLMGHMNGYMFDEERPKLFNYAALGRLIGHEINHGFDAKGRYYDHEGKI